MLFTDKFNRARCKTEHGGKTTASDFLAVRAMAVHRRDRLVFELITDRAAQATASLLIQYQAPGLLVLCVKR